jgi:hypothetical protein
LDHCTPKKLRVSLKLMLRLLSVDELLHSESKVETFLQDFSRGNLLIHNIGP